MTTTQWQYLEKRPHPWRQQLCFQGRRLKAFDVWSDMIVNEMTPEEAALNWDLPLAAVNEAIEYCETNQPLLKREAEAVFLYISDYFPEIARAIYTTFGHSCI